MSQKTTHSFNAEVSELLNLLAHSLYSNPEIFLRELISNASDALDKRKTLSLLEPDQYSYEDAYIDIELDEAAKKLIIKDTGIGMDISEVQDHLGTLASSGTKKFMQQFNSQSDKKNMIGQFGVGFYSAFVVADKVTVTTRRANLPSDQAVCWVSDGKGSYDVSIVNKNEIGTCIELDLRENAVEFATTWRLKQIVSRYSDYVKFPIRLKNDKSEMEQINKAKALWSISRSELTDEDYANFYKEVSHDFEDPIAWTHNKVEGVNDYTLLLYVPKRAPFDLWQRDMKKGLKLFVNRVYIMDGVDVFLPNYMRFVRGVIDAADLPLNVSRELLQKNDVVDVIKQGCVKRVLDMLEALSLDEVKYKEFWNVFGTLLKEGPMEDFSNMQRLEKLFRFTSTHNEMVSLEAYVKNMREGQEHIYFLTAESLDAARWSPHLEYFRKHDIEVLLLPDRIDEWLMSRLTTFEGKSFKSVAGHDVDLPKAEDETIHRDVSDLLVKLKSFYGDKIADVLESKKLTDSPACLLKGSEQIPLHLVKMLQEAGQVVPEQKLTLGINPSHNFISRMLDSRSEDEFSDLAQVLLDQALLAEGGVLTSPMSFIKAMNRLITTD